MPWLTIRTFFVQPRAFGSIFPVESADSACPPASCSPPRQQLGIWMMPPHIDYAPPSLHGCSLHLLSRPYHPPQPPPRPRSSNWKWRRHSVTAYRSNHGADFVAVSAIPREEGSHTRTCSLDSGEVQVVGEVVICSPSLPPPASVPARIAGGMWKPAPLDTEFQPARSGRQAPTATETQKPGPVV
jgi:hypothetical protein